MADYMEIARRALEQHHQDNHGPNSLEMVLKGSAIELWCDLLGEVFWLVADEDDAALLKEPRGTTYTAAEARLVCRITDPEMVREVHTCKRTFNGKVRDYRTEGKG